MKECVFSNAPFNLPAGAVIRARIFAKNENTGLLSKPSAESDTGYRSLGRVVGPMETPEVGKVVSGKVKISWKPADAQKANYELVISEKGEPNKVITTKKTGYDMQINANKVYRFKVRALNPCGSGGYSEDAIFTSKSLPEQM